MDTQSKEQIAPRSIGIDPMEIVVRLIKYCVEGGAVAFVAWLIAQGKKDAVKLTALEVLIIALTAAATFGILDLFAPAVGTAARQGSGFALGAQSVGWPGIGVPV